VGLKNKGEKERKEREKDITIVKRKKAVERKNFFPFVFQCPRRRWISCYWNKVLTE
jgi:hypothetical protein